MANRRRWDLAQVALWLYALSLVLPAIVVLDKPLFGGTAQPKTFFGGHCLLIGWLVWPGWLANPLFGIAYVLHLWNKHAAAAVLLLLAVLSAILGLLILKDLNDMKLVTIHVGYVVWLASIVVMLLATVSPPRFRETFES